MVSYTYFNFSQLNGQQQQQMVTAVADQFGIKPHSVRMIFNIIDPRIAQYSSLSENHLSIEEQDLPRFAQLINKNLKLKA